MLIGLLLCVFTIISFVLYCCISCSTTYDKELDDIVQEEFTKKWKKDGSKINVGVDDFK